MEEKQSPKGLVIGIVIAVLAVAGVAVWALSNQQDTAPNGNLNQSDDNTGSSDTASETVPAPSERVSITFTENGFEPRNVTVKKGTVITVKNESSSDVQFSSADHPTHRKNSEMNMESLSPGESGSYIATKIGVWGYHDHLDDSKTGSVAVE